MNALGGLLTAGHGSDYQTGTVGRVTADEEVLGVLGVFGFQEAHGQQTEFCLVVTRDRYCHLLYPSRFRKSV